MKLMLFAYDFPHRKTQDILFHLLTEGYKISYVIGAPWQELNYKKPIFRDRPYRLGLIHPEMICKRFGIPYVSLEHNSEECIRYITEHPVDYGVITGARILKENTINTFKKGIVNIHPGILPDIRGLDTLKWSIVKDRPIGNTVHLISKIDAGKIVFKQILPLYKDDTMIDISLRLFEVQPILLVQALQILKSVEIHALEDIDNKIRDYYGVMDANTERVAVKLFPSWLAKYSQDVKKTKEEKSIFIHPTAEVSEATSIGENTQIWNNVQIRENCKIGSNCNIGKNVYIDFDVQIGNKCRVQNNCSLYHGLHVEDAVFIGPHVVFANDKHPRAINPDGSLKTQDDWEVLNTHLGYGVSIGAHSVILPGVEIGKWAMIGSGSVVTKNVDDFCLVYGNPARVHGYVCICGRILPKNLKCECGRVYKLNEGKITPQK